MIEKLKSLKKDSKLASSHFEFLNKGLACHALCLLEYAGILSKLKKKQGKLFLNSIEEAKNPHLLRAALSTLVGAKVLNLKNDAYSLTPLGMSLAENVGTLMLPFVGYKNLIAKQYHLLDHPNDWEDSEINYEAIAIASINFGIHHLDPILIELVKYIRPKGTLCDLGCGTGEKLVKICNETNIHGLGIEKCPQVINQSLKYTQKNSNVEVIQGDIKNLKGIWEDVELGIISFVLHDITCEKECVNFLGSLKEHFPRMRCFIVVDIVSMSEDLPTIMPGFDYVHGLQGITPRNYRESRKVFSESGFKVINEITIPNMPNTFIWVLEPKQTILT